MNFGYLLHTQTRIYQEKKLLVALGKGFQLELVYGKDPAPTEYDFRMQERIFININAN